jgi:hypothetical protein
MSDALELLDYLFNDRVSGFHDKVDLLRFFDSYKRGGYPLTPDLSSSSTPFIISHVDSLFDFARFVIDAEPFSLSGFFYKHSDVGLDDFIVKRDFYYGSRAIVFSSVNHEFEPFAGCELARLGLFPDEVEDLLPVVLKYVDELKSDCLGYHKSSVLSSALRLACRSDLQCPVDLSSHIKSSKGVFDDFPELGNRIRYDGARLVSNVFPRAARIFNLPDKFISECDDYLSLVIERHPGFLANWMATSSAIIYLVGKDYKLTQDMVVSDLGLISKQVLRRYYGSIKKS